MRKAQPIDELLVRETDHNLVSRLQRIQQIRRFAVQQLGLPDNDSYTRYVDLQRPYVVWNVFATPAFSFQPVTSCYPLIGCLAYRGYFSRDDAVVYANQLKTQGLDVYIGGVAAYSTLGFTDDPVLNTMMRWSDARLAGLIFHELSHQVIYIKGSSSLDTAFNEAFATAVQQAGVERWLEQQGRADEIRHARWEQAQYQSFVDLVQRSRERLQTIYDSDRSEEEKRRLKSAQFQHLRKEYQVWKTQWNNDSGFDAWFDHDLNNARLMAVSTYHEAVPAFLALLESLEYDFPAFYEAVRQAGQLSPAERQAWLDGWQVYALNRNHESKF